MLTPPLRRTRPALDSSGVYVELPRLLNLREAARGLALLPRQATRSVLAGRHQALPRGRGLDFEELRPYWPGDDARLIDWKVTARLRKPFVRLFAEERDRPILLLVDQRMNQFFGSQRALKSVLAAELAALLGWTALAQHDRVGALIFGDDGVDDFQPARGTKSFLQLLHSLVRHNHALHAENPGDAPERLNQVLREALRLAKHDHLVVLISDLHGMDEQTRLLLARLRQHNDVLACWTHDPLLAAMPAEALVASNGRLQMLLDFAQRALRQGVEQLQQARRREILSWPQQLGVTVLPISTAAPGDEQLRRLLGQLPRRTTSRA